MIRLNVNRLLSMRGIKFGAVWLSKRGLSYKQAARLTSGKVASISFRSMDKLCRAFECTPNELLSYEPVGNEHLRYLEPLRREKKTVSPQDLLENLSQAEVERLINELGELKKGKA